MQATRNLILYPNLVLVPSENRILIGTSLAISSREPRLLQSVFNKALLRLDPQEKERILLKNEIRTPPHFSLSYFVTFYPLQTGLLMGGILLLICLAIFLRTTLDRRRIAAAQHAALEAYKYHRHCHRREHARDLRRNLPQGRPCRLSRQGKRARRLGDIWGWGRTTLTGPLL